ncbi:MAG: carbohydrate kinase [Ktedonobacterales bacterium]|nr:carbohydrate kinase [Ktedonobacterales bacterium]
MIDVVAVGEVLIDLIATERNVTLFAAPAFVPFPGGAPANVAVGVARLGHSAAFIGKVGRDEFGQGLRGLLAREGVLTQGLLDDADQLTTLAAVSVATNGDPHFAFFAGAHANLRAEDLDHDLLANARIVHGGSVMLAREPGRAATLAAWEIGRTAGAMCAYDVNWRPALWPNAAAGVAIVRAPLAFADIVKMNAAEVQLLTGIAEPRAGLAALATPAALVVVTLGGAGCLYRLGNEITAVAAPPVAEVVDATGAGDAFMAALLAGLPDHPARLGTDAITAAVGRACRAGAIAVTRRGAIPALPTATELDHV